MTGRDPKSIIDDGTMRIGQWLAVLVTVGLNALDGFDVLSISFASPGIAKDWSIDKATLGWVLSMELLGMAVGSLVLGGVADKSGRRPTILGCLVAMAIGMWGAGHAQGVPELLAWRLLTGIGIGGTLASINAAAAELSNRRWRSLALAVMVIGYPVGGVLGGLFVQRLLASATWHSVFFAGAWVTAAFIPIVWLLVPESVAFLDRRRGPGALEHINRILAALWPSGGERTERLGAARREALDRRHTEAGAARDDRTHHVRLFHPHHQLLLRAQVGAEDRRRHGLRAAGRGRRAHVGERRRRHRWRDLRPARHALRCEAPDHPRAAGRGIHDRPVRPQFTESRRTQDHARSHGLLHQLGDRRALPPDREGIPDARARHGHWLCHWRGPRRRGARAGACRISFPCWLSR